jgi:hypothetical protein
MNHATIRSGSTTPTTFTHLRRFGAHLASLLAVDLLPEG